MDWRYERLKNELHEKCGFNIDNIWALDQYDSTVSHNVLSILLQWACYSQSYASIELGRSKIAEVSREWLRIHLFDVVKHRFDYSDVWNYRRLLELAAELVPESKDRFIALNKGTNDSDLAEVIDDFM